MLEGDRGQLRKQVAARWLLSLDPQTANAYWDFTAAPPQAAIALGQGETLLFEAKLLDNMYDAVVFINCAGPHRAVEPRGRTVDGHRRREHPPTTLAPGHPQALR